MRAAAEAKIREEMARQKAAEVEAAAAAAAQVAAVQAASSTSGPALGASDGDAHAAMVLDKVCRAGLSLHVAVNCVTCTKPSIHLPPSLFPPSGVSAS